MTDSGSQTETWKPLPGFPAYQASDRGRIRSIDRTAPDGRFLRGRVLAARPSNRGYLLVNLTDDQGVRQTRTVHTLVLLAFAGPCPRGRETLHGPGGPQDNRWPENLRYGTKSENGRDRTAFGIKSVPPEPVHDCLNHERCGNKVINPGRRCRDCVAEVGVEAAAMLRRGVNLEDVAGHFGYGSLDWPYSLAVEHGGYGGTKQQARAQHPTLVQRVRHLLRRR